MPDDYPIPQQRSIYKIMKVSKLKKGLDIPLIGEAGKAVRDYKTANYAVKPTDFRGVFPKLLVREGDQVKAGTPLFFDKYRERIKVVAPVSGTITEIKRGKKRVIEEICIAADGRMDYESFGSADPGGMSREEVLDYMLKSGTFALIHQLPYAIIADPAIPARDVFISTFDTAPLAPDLNLVVGDEALPEFQAGIDALGKLTDGKVYLGMHPEKSTSRAFTQVKGVERVFFSGPHPAGNPGIQIHHTAPVNKGENVWYLRPADVQLIGRTFLKGIHDATTLVALTGSEIDEPQYITVLRGFGVEELMKARVKKENVRYISGNVLSGTRLDRKGYGGYFHNQLSIIPEGNYYEMFGWALPGFGKFSVSRSYFSWLMPAKKYRLDTNYHGGERAYVMSGEYEAVLPMDILPVHLIKAIMIEDIDLMENLGIYEVAEEDFALCEFVCTSKVPVQEVLRKGLDLMRKEMS